jgi:hypothetical protein
MRTIQMVPVADLVKALDSSVDNWDCLSMNEVWEEKTYDIVPAFRRSIKRHGIKMPVCVRVLDGIWTMGNGHHRVVVAMELGIDIPVVFVDDIDSWDYMCEDITCSARYVGSDGHRDRS